MWTYPLTRTVKVFQNVGCCSNVASVPKAPFISYSRISYFGHACPKLNFVLRDLVKLKKIKKSDKNSDWPHHSHPQPSYPFFFFSGKHVQQQKTTRRTQKTPQNFTKKRKSELGIDPPNHFRVFFGFLDFCNLTKPLISRLTGKQSRRHPRIMDDFL